MMIIDEIVESPRKYNGRNVEIAGYAYSYPGLNLLEIYASEEDAKTSNVEKAIRANNGKLEHTDLVNCSGKNVSLTGRIRVTGDMGIEIFLDSGVRDLDKDNPKNVFFCYQPKTKTKKSLPKQGD